MRMNKWRKRKDGVRPTGYKCYNQLNNGVDKITDARIEGFCSHASSRVRKYLSAHKKIGCNDMCPCGSGRKYKNCHGKV